MGTAKQFSADLTKWGDALDGRLDILVRDVFFDVAESIVVGGEHAPGSPVDTGFFRASWQVGFGSPPPVGKPHGPPGAKSHSITGDPLGAALLVLAGARAGPSLFLTNDTAYGLPLEYGSSKQAPRGMVRLTLAQAQAIVDARVRTLIGRA